MTRVLTGIQPSGTLHLGNYFAALRPVIEMQQDRQVFAFIADLHALSTVQNRAVLRVNTLNAAADFLASGLDPQRAVFFLQSQVPEHAELMWILSTVTPMGLLQRCHAFKDKVAHDLAATHGLFAYPVLQAADILLYDVDLVPVGQDQRQHLEVTRDIATKFNDAYGANLLKLPAPHIPEKIATVPGTDGKKMSKSYGNTINMFASEKDLRKQVMRIKTDSTPLVESKDPRGSIILALYRLVASPGDIETMEMDFQRGGIGYGEFKQRLFERILEYFAVQRRRREDLLANPDVILEILHSGACRARAVANETMTRIRESVGIAKVIKPQ